jgi:hypothetical protein
MHPTKITIQPWEDRLVKKILEYFERGFVRHEADYWAAQQIRSFAKWWLDLVRNALVVSALIYLAYKSDSVPLKTFAYFTGAVLFAYCTSYYNNWSFVFFPGIKRPFLNVILNTTLWVVVYGVVFWSSIAAVAAVAKALLAIQVR